MMECDPKGPLVLNVLKLYHSSDQREFYSFARVISGTIRRGQNVKVLGEAYNLEEQEDVNVKQVEKLWIYQSRYKIEVDLAMAGTWVLI